MTKKVNINLLGLPGARLVEAYGEMGIFVPICPNISLVPGRRGQLAILSTVLFEGPKKTSGILAIPKEHLDAALTLPKGNRNISWEYTLDVGASHSTTQNMIKDIIGDD